jgi:hypothetical protein
VGVLFCWSIPLPVPSRLKVAVFLPPSLHSGRVKLKRQIGRHKQLSRAPATLILGPRACTLLICPILTPLHPVLMTSRAHGVFSSIEHNQGGNRMENLILQRHGSKDHLLSEEVSLLNFSAFFVFRHFSGSTYLGPQKSKYLCFLSYRL